MSDRLSELLDTLKSEASSGNEYNNRLAVAAAEKDVREYIDARIAAERERCAQVALAYARESDPFSIERVIATEIKNMIRRGDV